MSHWRIYELSEVCLKLSETWFASSDRLGVEDDRIPVAGYRMMETLNPANEAPSNIKIVKILCLLLRCSYGLCI